MGVNVKIMKKFVKPLQLNIDVDVIFRQILAPLIATKVLPILDDNSELDDFAYSNYQTFIENIEGMLDYYDFDIVDTYISQSKPKTSIYYIFRHKKNVAEENTALIVQLRVSDHIQHLSEEHKQRLRQKFKSKVDEFKLPSTKNRQHYTVSEVIVNDDTFPTYEKASEYIEELVRNWLIQCHIDLDEYDELGPWA